MMTEATSIQRGATARLSLPVHGASRARTSSRGSPRRAEGRAAAPQLSHRLASGGHISKTSLNQRGGRRRSRGERGGVAVRGLPDDVDWGAVRGYVYATVVQFGLILCALKALDFVFPKLAWDYLAKISFLGDGTQLPGKAKSVAVFLFFLYMSFRSRIFSPLDNRRPTLSSEASEIQQRKRPNWMPPPLAFPIIWTTIGVLRATSSTLIWKAVGGKFLAAPLVFFLAHLCIGDTWNTINNVDKEYGVATLSMVFVVGSVCTATAKYYATLPKAGMILAPSCVWISIASFLVFSIWRLNGKQSLYPKKTA